MNTREFLKRHLVWDNHACMPLRPGDHSFLPQLDAVRETGVDITVLNITFDAMEKDLGLAMAASFRAWIEEHADRYQLVRTVRDIEDAHAHGRMGICFDIEGGVALNGDLAMVQRYYDLGVRWMLMAYNNNNALGGGCQDDDPGLSDYGRAVVREMERVGMMVCCSHTGFRTTMDVMAWAEKPVIFSHSNPLALHAHKRNITDEAIRACADTGGVVCLNGIGIFLGANDASPATFARHVDYVAKLVGVEHVGIGLDYCYDMQEVNDYVRAHPELFPPEDGYADGIHMLSPLALPEVVEALVGMGYGEMDLAKILGGNLQRVAMAVWK